jgi:hypothetical protein
MNITSSAIDAQGQILPKYTCDGDNVNPPLTFSQIPDGTQSLTLIMEDIDAPHGIFTHWIIYDMSPATLQIVEKNMPPTGITGINDFGNIGYGGACPPSGTHRYYFRLYALDSMLGLSEGASKHEVMEAINAAHVLEEAELLGTYTRKSIL